MNETSIPPFLAQASTPASTQLPSPTPAPTQAPVPTPTTTPTQAQPTAQPGVNPIGFQVDWSIDAGDILNFLGVILAAFIASWVTKSVQNQIRERRAKLIDDWRDLIENSELSILDLSEKLKDGRLEKHLLENSRIIIDEQIKVFKDVISNDSLSLYVEHPSKEKFSQYLTYEVVKKNKERAFRNEIKKELNRLEEKWKLI